MNWIKRRRRELRMSQQELSDRLLLEGVDVSRGTISHWEAGIRAVSYDDPELVNALANVLSMSVVGVLIEAGYKIDREGFSENAKRAAEIVDLMPPRRQNTALHVLEQLLTEN